MYKISLEHSNCSFILQIEFLLESRLIDWSSCWLLNIAEETLSEFLKNSAQRLLFAVSTVECEVAQWNVISSYAEKSH